jgi:lysophospholipase L1-like esterase
MTNTRRLLPLLFVLLLVPVASANARPVPLEPPARVQIGRAALGRTAEGDPSILVPVTYPIQLTGRMAPLQVTLFDRSGNQIFNRKVRVRLSAGELHRPERRRSFFFVHRVDLLDRPAVQLERGMQVQVRVRGWLDVDADGTPELTSGDSAAQSLPLTPSRAICSTAIARRTRPGRRTTVPLPACTTPRQWHIVQQPEGGQAHLEGGSLVYRSRPGFRGTDTLTLNGGRPVSFTVGAPGEVVIRALGDSVTAGFGYYSNGRPMTIGHLLECRPPERKFDDACSSNSLNASSKATEVVYAPDYGLSNNVSWAAQWANDHGVTDYANFAVSGSAPKDWAPEGQFHETTERIEAEDPDYVLMTMGANPLLSEMLFGVDNMGCAIYSQIFGGYSECVERAFAKVELRENLKRLYADLVQHTDATIYLMQYHLSVPSVALAYSATQIAEMGQLLNREIAAAAAEVNPKRLQVVTPPHFNVGIDISPVYPSTFTCSRFGYLVDGPSAQSTPTQDELDVLHPLSFCEGPEGGGPPWVISGDTGIHPSAAGYAQMAAQVPPPSK